MLLNIFMYFIRVVSFIYVFNGRYNLRTAKFVTDGAIYCVQTALCMYIYIYIYIYSFPTVRDRDRASPSVPILLDSTAHERGNTDFGIAGLCAVL